jgi:hypothetical protein
MTELQAVSLVVIGLCIWYLVPKIIRYIYKKEIFHMLFCLCAIAMMFFNFIDTGLLFCFFAYLVWPMDPAPEPGLLQPKDRG